MENERDGVTLSSYRQARNSLVRNVRYRERKTEMNRHLFEYRYMSKLERGEEVYRPIQ